MVIRVVGGQGISRLLLMAEIPRYLSQKLEHPLPLRLTNHHLAFGGVGMPIHAVDFEKLNEGFTSWLTCRLPIFFEAPYQLFELILIFPPSHQKTCQLSVRLLPEWG